MSDDQKVRFGVFEADLETRELRRNGLRVRLPDQPFSVLEILLANPGKLVTREELQQQIWPNDVFVDFDQGLNKAINRIREALGDSASSPLFVETIPRRGYRFIAPIAPKQTENEPTLKETISVEAQSQSLETVTATADMTTPSTPVRLESRRKGFHLPWAIAAITAIILIAAFLALWYHNTHLENRSVDSLAVLPIALDAKDSDLEYLSDGVTENLINSLSRFPHLRVMARSTVFHYKGQDVDARTVGKDLHVRAVLTGRLIRAGKDIDISLEMTDVSDGSQIWGEKFRSSTGDTQSVENDMTSAIANRLLKLSSDQQGSLTSRKTVDPEAYRLYLLGRFYWNKRTTDGLNKAADFFEQAIQHDLNYAPAYAGLADAYGQLSWDSVPPTAYMPRAKAMAARSLQLDDDSAESHTSMAMIKELYDWDFEGAEREFQRAIELNPGYATAHHWYGVHLAAMRRFGQARTELNRALELDPLSLPINANAGYPDYFTHNYPPAIKAFRRALEMDRSYPYVHEDLMLAYEQTGEVSDAMNEGVRLLELSGDPVLARKVSEAFHVGGREAALQTWLDALLQRSKSRYVSPVAIAQIYSRLGNKDKAIEWLQKAVSAKSQQLVYIKTEPLYDSLRADPRFRELLKKVGLT